MVFKYFFHKKIKYRCNLKIKHYLIVIIYEVYQNIYYNVHKKIELKLYYIIKR